MKRASAAFCREIAGEFAQAGHLRPGYTLKLCGDADLDDILALGLRGFAYNTPSRAEIRYALTKTHGGIFGLYDEGKARLAGYILLEAHAGREDVYLNTVVIDDDYRGQGLGQIFYRFNDFLIASLGARSIWSHAAIDNDINIHLLRKNGYLLIREEKDYYDDGRPALVFRKYTGEGEAA